jgi:uracil-DNA glycosylase
MNKMQRKKANAVLFRNCKEYLEGELAILRPAVVVSQGNEASRLLKKAAFGEL